MYKSELLIQIMVSQIFIKIKKSMVTRGGPRRGPCLHLVSHKDKPLNLRNFISLKITHLKYYGNRISVT